MKALGRYFLNNPVLVAILVVVALLGLPFSVWMDLRNLSDKSLMQNVSNLDKVISEVRSYYASNVVGRMNQTRGETPIIHNYKDVPGAIPIPATLSLELADVIAAPDVVTGRAQISYRFVSDFPFAGRSSHNLTPWETSALSQFRASRDPEDSDAILTGNLFDRSIQLATPIVMGQACVSCHNTHKDSPKTDWKVGDIRGIQSIALHQPIAMNIWSFKWLLGYMALAGTAGLVFAVVQFSLARSFQDINAELTENNTFLADISLKISRYISPQIYHSIFSGEKDTTISTQRKKLTIFFTDIKDFTATTEQLQPEALTELLNEYFTEMSAIAEAHGATIDKFIGDAIVGFFGDPETKGVKEDARACVRMAIEMQHRLLELADDWRARGVERPLRARIGINTGYCNVGNFGSDKRMDYTIIGAEANLAARLETLAPPGGILMSYETWAHCRDMVAAVAIEPTHVKGIAREIVPYCVKPEAIAALSDQAHGASA